MGQTHIGGSQAMIFGPIEPLCLKQIPQHDKNCPYLVEILMIYVQLKKGK
jgi:hypothetical protein